MTYVLLFVWILSYPPLESPERYTSMPGCLMAGQHQQAQIEAEWRRRVQRTVCVPAAHLQTYMAKWGQHV